MLHGRLWENSGHTALFTAILLIATGSWWAHTVEVLQKELKEIDRDKGSGVTIQITEGNLQKLTGFVEGPKDTSYEGGYFVVDITLGNCFVFV